METLEQLLLGLGADVVVELIRRGAAHPDTPATVSHAVRAIAGEPLASDAVEARASALLKKDPG